jgi:hypothetical protein
VSAKIGKDAFLVEEDAKERVRCLIKAKLKAIRKQADVLEKRLWELNRGSVSKYANHEMSLDHGQ